MNIVHLRPEREREIKKINIVDLIMLSGDKHQINTTIPLEFGIIYLISRDVCPEYVFVNITRFSEMARILLLKKNISSNHSVKLA